MIIFQYLRCFLQSSTLPSCFSNKIAILRNPRSPKHEQSSSIRLVQTTRFNKHKSPVENLSKHQKLELLLVFCTITPNHNHDIECYSQNALEHISFHLLHRLVELSFLAEFFERMDKILKPCNKLNQQRSKSSKRQGTRTFIRSYFTLVKNSVANK